MTNSVLESMPDAELMEKPLDLGRPELAGVMRRYCPRGSQERTELPRPYRHFDVYGKAEGRRK